MSDPLDRNQLLHHELVALGEGTMMIEQFDGFIAGILVCPELISPNEWLPVIWSEDDGRKAPFKNIEHANKVFGLIMGFYNDVALTLMNEPESYAPLFPVFEDSDEILWEVWIEGFVEAIRLRPEAWERLCEADEATSDAMLGMLALGGVVDRNDELPSDLTDDLTRMAPDLIPGWVVTLNNWRIANSGTRPTVEPSESLLDRKELRRPASSRKVGRNEPCPCGSGKKYKRCCGLN